MSAELVFLGGDLRTMNEAAPSATALAVRGSKIVAVGNDEEVSALIGDETRVVKLNGKTVTPGLVDGHCHLYSLGRTLESVQLRGVESAQEAAQRVAAFATELGPKEWVDGRGWDQNLWTDQVFPTKEVLDEVEGQRPVILRRIDGHAIWVNSVVLTTLGIDGDTEEVAGGKIIRDEAGTPTGVFIDEAMMLVYKKMPEPSVEVVKRRVLAGATLATQSGITAIHDMGIGELEEHALRALSAEGRLPIRVYAYIAGDPEMAASLAGRPPEESLEGQSYFVLRGIKLFADGALGSRGAAMLDEYSDDPGNKGLFVTEPEALTQATIDATAAGWQVAVHAIGDAGNRITLDAFEAATKRSGDKDLRLRLEHAQILSPADLPRLAKLDVIASMQPTHATSDMEWADERLGAERLKGAYAWRSVIDSGALLVAGSDFPVEKVSPLLGLYASVSRQDSNGQPEGGFTPNERIGLNEALAAFTKNAAYAAFVEDYRGQLKPGYVADLTIFDRALSAGPELLQTQIDMTLVGGAVRYEAQ